MLTFATTLCYALLTPTTRPWVPERHGFLSGAHSSPKYSMTEVIERMSAKPVHPLAASPVDREAVTMSTTPLRALSTIDSVHDASHSVTY